MTNGREARLKPDNSFVWDSGDTFRQDEPLKMLDAFDLYVRQLLESEDQAADLRRIVDVIVSRNRLAVLWKHLLVLGSQAPSTLGQQIKPLAWALPILVSIDTTVAAGSYVGAQFAHLPEEDREQVERAILSIPHSLEVGTSRAREQTRNRLLGCLADEYLVTGEARHLRKELTSGEGIPPNTPLVGPIEVTWEGAYSEEEFLADRGVPVEAEPNQSVRRLERPVRAFCEDHQNTLPTESEIRDALPQLLALRDALLTADEDGVHQEQSDYAWGYLAKACERIASCDSLTCASEVGAVTRDILLRAAALSVPVHQPEDDDQFKDFPSGGSPAARIDAAAGLTLLAHHDSCADEDVLRAVDRLSRDSVPAVRFQVATRLRALYQTAPELMWSIAERFSSEEASKGVLQGLVHGSLWWLARPCPDQAVALVEVIYRRVTEGPGDKSVREACARVFLDLYIWQDNPLARELALEIAGAPADSSEEANRLVLNLRDLLTYGPVSPLDPSADEVRGRAIRLMGCVLHSSCDLIHELESRYEGGSLDSWRDEDQVQIRALFHLVDSVGMQIYFASGAFEKKRHDKEEPGRALGVDKKQRFLEELGPLLDELAELGYPTITHHLLETLETFIPLDPLGVFRRIGCIIRAGQAGGYQYESLAVDLVVQMIERYLAEYRAIFHEDEASQRTLLDILDTFVRAGWPSARRLTYRLEEIFW
jgi:hypothetical protein